MSGEMLSRNVRTVPSPIAAMTMPLWKLNGSSFGPQLLVRQGQPPVFVLGTKAACGPPTGVAD